MYSQVPDGVLTKWIFKTPYVLLSCKWKLQDAFCFDYTRALA
jgi:hypothetical protein